MGWADTQLEPGERVLLTTGLHPIAFSGATMLAAFVGLVVTLLIRHNELPVRVDLQIALIGLIVALIGALPALLRWRNTVIVLTDRRLLVRAGAFRPRSIATSLERAGIEQEASLTGRFLDHGTVTIATPDGAVSSVSHVARARELVEQARGRARRMPRRGVARV